MARKKGKRQSNRLYWITGSIIIALLVYIGVVLWHQFRGTFGSGFAMYDNFGIELPLGYDIHGIDVSVYQQQVHWPSVTSMKDDDVRIGFTFIKATEGLGNTDKQFKRNWQKAAEAGLTRGAYHFFIATKDGKAQAKHFIRTVRLKPGDLPPVLDVEERYGVPVAVMQQRVKDFLETVEAAYGVKPVIYTNAAFYTNYLGPAFDDYPLWVAHYFEQQKPRVMRDWQFWQHSSTGTVNGIKGHVDFNVFNGDSARFRRLLMR